MNKYYYSEHLKCYVGLLKGKDGEEVGNFLVCEEGYKKCKDILWCRHPNGYVQTSSKKNRTLLHRLCIDAKQGQVVDHKNRNKTDCRLNNLRLVTKRQNERNIGPRKNSKSKYKGVSFRKDTKKWTVRYHFGSQKVNLGCYSCEKEAARVYDKYTRENSPYPDMEYYNNA